jgi:hypothetical protein
MYKSSFEVQIVGAGECRFYRSGLKSIMLLPPARMRSIAVSLLQIQTEECCSGFQKRIRFSSVNHT